MTAEDKELIKDIKLIANGKESTNQDEFLLMFIKAVCKKYHQHKVNEVSDERIKKQAIKKCGAIGLIEVIAYENGANYTKEQLLKQ